MIQAGRPTIVVADSDRTVLELLQIRLNVAGYQACTARGAEAAVDMVRGTGAAALIIDASGGGLDALEALAGGSGRLPCPTLLMGRKLSSSDVRRALALGAMDCMVKPFSGADALERVSALFRHLNEAQAAYLIEARCLEQKDLAAAYPHEAAEHRKILFARGSGMCATWSNLRQFLTDMGPAPDPDYLATRLVAGDLTYAPGKTAWMHRDRQPQLIDRSAFITPRARANGANPEGDSGDSGGSGRWTSVRGQPVEYDTLAGHLGVPVDTMAAALRNKSNADDLVQHASVAEALSQGDSPWLAPERRDAFMMGYRMWHMQVQPKFAAAATPAFLYLFSALPGMIKARDGLIQEELWQPATDLGRRKREIHPLWRKFNESMVRVEAARLEFAIYRQYSLTTELDDLWGRVKLAEERFRRSALAVAQAA